MLPSSQIDMPVPIGPAVMCRMAAGAQASGRTGSVEVEAEAEAGGSESMTPSRQGQVIITQTDLTRSFIEENGE